MHPDRRRRLLLRALLVCIFCAACGCLVFPAILPDPIAFSSATTQRWNPVRIPAGVEFAGDGACIECHRSRVEVQRATPMGQAMESVADSAILTSNPEMKLRLGRFTYEITRRGSQSIFTVADDKEVIQVPIDYAFGQGKAGQTYVFQRNGAYYESRVSYYNEIRGLDLTIGTPPAEPKTLEEALGRRLSKDDALKCFNCHSTGAVSGASLHTENLIPGVRCEACHGPGGEHIAANKSEKPEVQAQTARLIFNPARLGGDALTQDFCASCHRGSEEFSLLRSMGVNNVRFQPYRIFTSKCYSNDKRISCTACHNPHEPLKEDVAHYDTKCLACHTSDEGATKAEFPACSVGEKDCASCHMPKVEPPGAHFKFTDHMIRIVRPGEPYPN